MSKNKTKALGKAVIVLLSIAIVVFLLLPFLDSSASDGKSGNSKGKKAIAQIFTSNPLTDLAKKIFAMFKKENPQQKPQSYAYAESEDFAEWTAEQRAAAEHDAVAADASETTSVDANFNYSEGASMIDEDGEWILVRQTTPEASQKGMHDITSKESAYDRLVRQERAAKYTGKATDAAGPAIPDSKWARLWKPIKNFFGGEDEASAPQTPNTERFMLASADSGFGSNAFKRGRIGKSAGKAQIPGSLGTGFSNTADAPSLSELMDLDLVLSRTKDGLLENAKKTLKPEQYEKVSKEIEKRMLINHQKASAEIAKNIENAAQNSQANNLIEKTFYAGESGSSSLYSSSTEQNGAGLELSLPIVEDDQKVMQQQNLDTIRRTFDVPGFRHTPQMIAVLGKTEDFDPTLLQENNEQSVHVSDYYQLLLEKNKCKEKGCVWVMLKPPSEENEQQQARLQGSIAAAGFQPLGVEREIEDIDQSYFMAEFSLKQMDEDLNDDIDLSMAESALQDMEEDIAKDNIFGYTEEQVIAQKKEVARLQAEYEERQEANFREWKETREELKTLSRNYYPLPNDEFKKLIAGPEQEKDEKGHASKHTHKDMPFILGNAAAINNLVKDNLIEDPCKVIVDTDDKIMDVSKTKDDRERSSLITEASMRTFTRNKAAFDNAAQDLTAHGNKLIMQYSMENVQEELQKSAGKSADEIMGL
ncbi:MAG: hypothetical protein IKC13_02175 [Elusimicrobiaceae bacterium]|nr:hypothetical protein [Elusimicrobiaceae bacterium]